MPGRSETVEQGILLLTAQIRMQRQFEAFAEPSPNAYAQEGMARRICAFLDFKIGDDARNGPADVLRSGPDGMSSEQYDSLIMIMLELLSLCRAKSSPPFKTDAEWRPIEASVWSHINTKRVEHHLAPMSIIKHNADVRHKQRALEQLQGEIRKYRSQIEAQRVAVRERVYAEELPDFHQE